MKKILLCYLLLTTLNFYSQVSDIVHCSGDTTFDLTQQKPLLIGSLDPAETTVSYHLSLNDASNGANPIANADSFASNVASQKIYARIGHLGLITTNYFSLIVNPPLLSVSVISTLTSCINNDPITVIATGGQAPYLYSMDGNLFQTENTFSILTPGNYSITIKDAIGCATTTSVIVIEQPALPAITWTSTNVNCYASSDGSITIDASGGLAPYGYSIDGITFTADNVFSNLAAGNYSIYVKDANGCTLSVAADIAEPTPIITTIITENETIAITATGGTGIITYAISPNFNEFSTNNTFTNLAPDIYQVTTQDANGCLNSINVIITPPAPLVDGESIITQNLNAGQTLADIQIPGINIKWYSSPNAATGKFQQAGKTAGETPLPLTTVLVDNTTYYASQTINGIESAERLAVTVKLGALGTNDLEIKNFTYFPNPVKSILTISNTSIIDEITLSSALGKTILTKKINSLNSEIDLSNLSDGVYFMKVKSEDREKTVKIIKE